MSRASILLAGALVLLSGCMRNTISTGKPPGAYHELKGKFFLYGIVGQEDVNVGQLCPNGVSKIEEKTGVGDWLLTCVTVSIYTPRSIKVTCTSGSAYLLVPDEENNQTVVTPMDSSLDAELTQEGA